MQNFYQPGLGLSPDLFIQLEQEIDDRIEDTQKLFNFITLRDINKNISIQQIQNITFSGLTSIGTQYSIEFVIPPAILNPPQFSWSLYPLTINHKEFRSDRPYDYLANFNLSSFYEAKLPQYHDPAIQQIYEKLHTLLTELIEVKQCQTRSSTIWRNVGAVLHACDIKFQTRDYPLRYIISALLSPYVTFPFYEQRQRFQFNNTNISSQLPILIYCIAALACDLLVGNITHIESVIAFNVYLIYATTSIFDSQLKYKSIARNWKDEAVHLLNTCTVPRYNQFGLFETTFTRSTTEPQWISAEYTSQRELRQQLPQVYQNYINHVMRYSKTPEMIIKSHIVVRILSNTRAYLKTLPELSFKRAVEPQVVENVLPAFQVTKTANGMPLEMRPTEQSPSTSAYRYLSYFTTSVANKVSKKNFDTEWFNFVTTRSAGRKAVFEGQHLSEKIKRAANSRIVLEAIESRDYRSADRLNRARQQPTNMGIRDQIDRRQRGIFVIPNEILIPNLPIYLFMKTFLDITPYTMMGKDSGTFLDMREMLITTALGYYNNYSDVSAMDASVQSSLRHNMNAWALDVAALCTTPAYASYIARTLSVTHNTRSTSPGSLDISGEYINAVHQAIADASGFEYSSLSYNSRLFGTIFNYSQSFGSGLPQTSAHHTEVLIGLDKSVDLQSNHSPNCDINIRGDDKTKYLIGSDDIVREHLRMDNQTYRKAGFNVKDATSLNSNEFLQQGVLLGRYVPYPDRVSFITAEKPSIILDPQEKCNELVAIAYDMCARCYDQSGLCLLLFMLCAYTCRRLTLECAVRDLPDLARNKLWQDLRFRIRTPGITINDRQIHINDKTIKSVLIQIYYPLSWLLTYKGGELPPPALQREDGTMTSPHNIYYPRGKYAIRFLFDISDQTRIPYTNIPHNELLNKSQLRKYKLIISHNLGKLNLKELYSRARSQTTEWAEINDQARRLGSLSDPDAINAAANAAQQLELAGVRVPATINYAYTFHMRIIQAIEAIDVSNVEVQQVTKKFKDIITSDMFDLTLQRDDYLHAYRITYTTDLLPYKYPNLNITLGPSIQPYSDGWQLIQALGFMEYCTTTYGRITNQIKGEYGAFKKDDPTFQFGLHLWRHRRHLLDNFYTLINASPGVRAAYQAAFELSGISTEIPYPYTISPRQLFFITDNPSSAARYIDPNSLYYNAPRTSTAYLITIAYLHLLGHSPTFYGHRMMIEISRTVFARYEENKHQPG
ncbi:RNA-dependent RNA polymerase [Lutzomyia reovirus 1]|uniref:RNA-dependent RNA polymerase n=1 Tax=Lutzomyia reovirus 1 TaxID=1670669 RepID=UPI00065EED05|nr:RNA-dependent RNA polymerase [Lutzomyia reovirus 1]AKP18603.1 RNA-dependent RNA polymerase [Lutzomyia reovirus 1]